MTVCSSAGRERARSAYVADLDTDPTGPGSFVGWLNRAIDVHATRSPAERAALAEPGLQSTSPSTLSFAQAANGFKRALLLEVDTAMSLEDAVVADRLELGRLVTRSQFVREAALASAAEALRRYGLAAPSSASQAPQPARAAPLATHRPARRRETPRTRTASVAPARASATCCAPEPRTSTPRGSRSHATPNATRAPADTFAPSRPGTHRFTAP